MTWAPSSRRCAAWLRISARWAWRTMPVAVQATANAALEAANRATVLVGDLVAEVETIVTWIDQGATPPPPPVSPRLRTLLAQHGTRRPKET